MKHFKRIIPPRIQYGADRELEDAVNRALEDLTRATNDAITSLVRHIPQELPVWAEGEEVTLQCNSLYHTNAKEIAIRHGLGVKPTRYLVWNRTAQTWTGSPAVSGAHWHDILPTKTSWTDKFVYFYVTEDAAAKNTEFKILLLP